MKVFYRVHNVPIECTEIRETFIFISGPQDWVMVASDSI